MQRVAIPATRLRVLPNTWREVIGSSVSRNRVPATIYRIAWMALVLPSVAEAAALPPVKLAWNKNPEKNVAYYELRYGTASGDYSYKVYTGAETSATVTDLQEDTTYYFVVVARNRAGLASPNSREISYRVNGRIIQPPNGKIVSPAEHLTISVGDTVDFSASGKNPNDNTSLAYLWSFGSGSGVGDTQAKNPGTRRFDVPGTYTVTLNVTNRLGKEDPTPATRVITVKAPAYQVLARKGWKLKYVNSEDALNYPARYAFDDNPGTFWHTEWGKPGLPPPPHEIQIDLGSPRILNGFQYLPRQDGFAVGNIGSYRFYVSLDGKKWGKPVAIGTFENSSFLKSVFFAQKRARYVRLISVTEVHGYIDSSIAELQVLKAVTKKKKKKSASALVAKKASTAGTSSLAAAMAGAALPSTAASALPEVTTEVISGEKYLTLTVSKPAVPDGHKRTVQVSPDLLGWFSGRKHTTVLIDNERFLKVRDNTPFATGSKRFIRLKSTQY